MLFLFLFHFYSWENCQNVNKISQKQIWHQNTYSLDLWLIFSRFTSFHLSVGFWDVPLRDRDHEHNILGRTYKIFGRKTKAGNLLERAPTRGAAKKKKNKSGRNRECSLNKTSTKRWQSVVVSTRCTDRHSGWSSECSVWSFIHRSVLLTVDVPILNPAYKLWLARLFFQ